MLREIIIPFALLIIHCLAATNEPLYLINHVFGSLTVHILLVAPSEYVVDSFLFVLPLLDLHQIIIDLYNGLSPAMRLSRDLVCLSRLGGLGDKIVFLLKGDHLIRVNL